MLNKQMNITKYRVKNIKVKMLLLYPSNMFVPDRKCYILPI